jgi:hypothetical protein
LIIYGDKSETEKLHLTKENASALLNKLFEKGQTDVFKVKAANVGDIKRINISHDGHGIGNGWFIDSIKIENLATKKICNFPVSRWLDDDEGDKKIAIDLFPNQKPSQ